jgi:hypothetical protein
MDNYLISYLSMDDIPLYYVRFGNRRYTELYEQGLKRKLKL